MNTVVVAEIADGALTPGSLDALALVPRDGDLIVVATAPLSEECAQALRGAGAMRVFEPEATVVDSSRIAAVVRAVLAGQRAALVVSAPSATGREVVGRVSASWEAPLLTGVVSLEQEANGIAWRVGTVVDGGRRRVTSTVTAGRPLLTTAHPGVAGDVGDERGNAAPALERVPFPPPDPSAPTVSIVASEPLPHRGLDDLADARIIVAGGRGVGDPGTMKRLRAWAHRIGAAFGSSRAPVEAGWAPYDRLIGQTGTTVRPDVYLAWGISGAPQHLAGMRGARTVVSVNVDPSAPIAAESDVLLVADARMLLDQLEA